MSIIGYCGTMIYNKKKNICIYEPFVVYKGMRAAEVSFIMLIK